MTPERVAGLVALWVRLYTRNLPDEVAVRRVEEIAADVEEHVAHERAAGIGERRIALGIASRMLRGLAADAAWRGRHRRTPTREQTMTSTSLTRSAVRVAVGVALVLSLPLIAMLIGDQVVWGLGDFVAAGVLLTTIGVAVELAVKRAGNRTLAIAIAAAGVAAGILGEADDAPGLVLLGILLVVSGCALGVRAAQHSR
jgi:hypothetical protein